MTRHNFAQLTILFILPLIMVSFALWPARAGMINTAEAVKAGNHDAARATVNAFIARQDVQKVMTQHGVDVREAQKRVKAMSDTEIQEMAHRINSLPAGGSALGVVVGAAVFIFVVLLITDLLGLTHVFNFVNR